MWQAHLVQLERKARTDSGGTLTVNLRHANVAGRLVVIHVRLYFGSNNTGAQVGVDQRTLQRQGADVIVGPGPGAGIPSIALNRSASLSSDGQDRWILVGGN